MFVRENELVYFGGRMSSSPFTDEYPPPAVPAVHAFLRAPAPLRDANILLILSILSKIINLAPQALFPP
jgi:hypothetical protein